MKVIFVRHGESTGNAGAAAADHTSMILTATGQSQAQAVARQWQARPSLVAVSPYLRTQLTAQPTIERFPDVPVKVLPMEEFTYLEPSRWNGTLRSERIPHIEAFWEAADPAYRDGPGAESFQSLLARVERTLHLLETWPSGSLVYAFGHGQFMQAVRLVVSYPQWTPQEQMRNFWSFNARHSIGNTGLLEVSFKAGTWKTAEVERSQ